VREKIVMANNKCPPSEEDITMSDATIPSIEL
jgi:hypothetical protein